MGAFDHRFDPVNDLRTGLLLEAQGGDREGLRGVPDPYRRSTRNWAVIRLQVTPFRVTWIVVDVVAI